MGSHGQRVEVLRDLLCAHLRWMALAVEKDVAASPGDVLLLGAVAVVTKSDRVSYLVEQARLM